MCMVDRGEEVGLERGSEEDASAQTCQVAENYPYHCYVRSSFFSPASVDACCYAIIKIYQGSARLGG